MKRILLINLFLFSIQSCTCSSPNSQKTKKDSSAKHLSDLPEKNADELNKQSKLLIKSQDFEKAIPLLKRAAKLGNAEAQYNYGYILEKGLVVGKNADSAFKWYLKSAEQGFNDGLYKMMMAYFNGIGTEKNYEKGFGYALKCAENNDITCMFNLVSAYQEGVGTDKNIEKMLKWAIKLAKQIEPKNLTQSGYVTSSRLNLAHMYRDCLLYTSPSPRDS